MFGNYLKIAWRNLMRQKGYALVNVLGLAVGIATCLLIVRYIQDEFSYDAWHTKGDRVYRMIRETRSGGKSEYLPNTSGALAGAMREFPEVEKAIRTWPWGVSLKVGSERFEVNTVSADPDFFEILDYAFVKGSPEDVFQSPNNVGVTESLARRVFGDADPMGKTLTADGRHHGGEKTVVAVLKDVPENATLRFEIVMPAPTEAEAVEVWETWRATMGWRPIHTYVLLREGADPERLAVKLPEMIERFMGPDIRRDNDYHLQRLDRIYLYTLQDFGLDWYGDINRIYQFGAIALFVLAIGCVNFTNLTTAQSARRAREVGLRKVSGAYRSHLIRQFLGESILTAFLALLLSLVLVKLALPEFNAFFSKQLDLDLLDPFVLIALPCVAILVGVAAGTYPAVYLSSFEPTETLKGTFRARSTGETFRKALVVAQFGISILLIVGTGVVYQQLDYMRNKRLGFSTDQMVMVPIFWYNNEVGGDRQMSARYNTIKQAFLRHPAAIEATAYRWWLGWGGGITRTVWAEGHEGTDWRMPVLEVDEDYFDVFKIKLLEGRNFDPLAFASDTLDAFIVNETAVKTFGWDDPVGKTVTWVDRNDKGRVIGVVEDFHFDRLHQRIAPVLITCRPWQFYNVGIRVRAGEMDAALAHFESVWKEFVPEQPFESTFWDQQFAEMYEAEERTQALTMFSSGIAILLACMGLFGLASFATEERRKEIGVRKTLGASVNSVVLLVSREFLVMVAIAACVATPVAWTLMSGWLENFAYRTGLGPGVFVFGTVLALLIAQATVGYHAVRAARLDPVKALRYE